MHDSSKNHLILIRFMIPIRIVYKSDGLRSKVNPGYTIPLLQYLETLLISHPDAYRL